MCRRSMSFFTTMVMLLLLGPLTAAAKGPQPGPDFVVVAEVSASEWVAGTWVGTFSTSGIIEDSGDVCLVESFFESDGSLWQVYEFVGADGSFQSALRVRPLPHQNDSFLFEIVGTGGDYADLYGAGTATGHTHEKCYWVRDEPLYKDKDCTYTVDWTLDAYVP